jgi:hypothetical protein
MAAAIMIILLEYRQNLIKETIELVSLSQCHSPPPAKLQDQYGCTAALEAYICMHIYSTYIETLRIENT